ncbi:hypothetical protein AFLA70_213g001581 [Aspergillus flavus AF70]|nr:hypothetical protein AFLA70_213g001581 [Aspergillus flavus AF70]
MSQHERSPNMRPLMAHLESVHQIEKEKTNRGNLRRTRASIACTECRVRRLKCNGPAPCEECALHSRKCVIDPSQDRRRKMDVKALKQDLQFHRTFLYQLCRVIRECNREDVGQLVSLIRQGGTNEDIKGAVEEYLKLNSECSSLANTVESTSILPSRPPLSAMRHSPRPLGSNDDSGSTTDVPDIFSDDATDESSDSASDPDSDDDPEDLSDDDSILDDEEERELPAAYFLQEAECLDVSQLRQKRYSPRTQIKLDETRDYWDRFCREGNYNPAERFRWLSDSEETVRFFKAFFSWRCSRRRNKKGGRTPGIRYKSSLETFWKWWHLVYKAEVGHGLSKDLIVKILDVLAIVAREKDLRSGRRPKATMYIEDVAEFARVLLSTMEMTFQFGWLRIQLLLFCQLAAITGSRPGALLNLRYRDLELTLIRHPDGGRPRLFIYLTPRFTKTFLGEKEENTFPIPEIVFDPRLVLSPHVFLLGMLFRIQAFKNISKDGLVLDCPENLYNLGVLVGLGEQPLRLNIEIDEEYVATKNTWPTQTVRRFGWAERHGYGPTLLGVIEAFRLTVR